MMSGCVSNNHSMLSVIMYVLFRMDMNGCSVFEWVHSNCVLYLECVLHSNCVSSNACDYHSSVWCVVRRVILFSPTLPVWCLAFFQSRVVLCRLHAVSPSVCIYAGWSCPCLPCRLTFSRVPLHWMLWVSPHSLVHRSLSPSLASRSLCAIFRCLIPVHDRLFHHICYGVLMGSNWHNNLLRRISICAIRRCSRSVSQICEVFRVAYQ